MLLAACSRRDPEIPARKREAAGKLRVITMTPSATELLYAVGAIDLVVGVDQYSSFPAQVKALPKVGDFLAPSMEAVISLGCDIAVLDAVQEKFATQLNSMGIRTIALPMQTVEDVRAGLIKVGEAVGHRAGAEAELARLDASMRAAEGRARAAASRAGRAPRVLFVVDRRNGGLAGMVAAGPGTYLDDLMRRAGVVNVLADAANRYVQISAEEVLSRAPDIILDAVHDANPDRARADWDVLASVPAVAHGRVHVLGDPLFVTPGPRLDQAFSRLVDILWNGG